MTSTDRRWSSSSNRSENTKFPDFDPFPRDHLTIYEEGAARLATEHRTSSPNNYSKANGSLYSERWQARKENHSMWSNGQALGPGGRHGGHGRQKSLSDAIKTIRTRKGSVSANAHELAEALKAPVSYQLIVRTFMLQLYIVLTSFARVIASCGIPAPLQQTPPQKSSSMRSPNQ